MKRVIDLLAGAWCSVILLSGSGLRPSHNLITSTTPMSPTPPIPLAVAATASSPCPDPMAILKAFYAANDASQFEISLGFFAEDAILSTWAEGVNGHHMRETHLTGKAQIRPALGSPGLQHATGQPDSPIYHETNVKVSGDQVTFVLEPDRRRPNGKPYNPYKVEALFAGCKIKSLTVVDLVTWL